MSKPAMAYKVKACEVCGRDYRCYPIKGKRGVTYRGTCPYCGTTDFARGENIRGHLEIEGHDNQAGRTRQQMLADRKRSRRKRE